MLNLDTSLLITLFLWSNYRFLDPLSITFFPFVLENLHLSIFHVFTENLILNHFTITTLPHTQQYTPLSTLWTEHYASSLNIRLNSWIRVTFEKLIVTHLIMKFPTFMEPKGTLLCDPYPKPDEFTLHSTILCLWDTF